MRLLPVLLPSSHTRMVLSSGRLKRMAAASDLKVHEFLVEGFSRVGKKIAQEIGDKAGLKSHKENKRPVLR